MRATAAEDRAGGRKISPPRKPTLDRLSRIAIHYLERYSSSSTNLRRVLDRRIQRYVRETGDAVDGAELLDEVVRRCVSSGLIDDRRYADQVAFSQRRKGKSRQEISARLRSKGVDADVVGDAVSSLETSDEEAARRTAQRLRLGPWRTRERQERRQRDVAALCRHGFSLSIARAVIDAEDQLL